MLPTRGALGIGRGPPGLAPVDGAAGAAAAGAAGAGAAGAAGAGAAGAAGAGRPGFGALNVGVGTAGDATAGAAGATGAAGAAGAAAFAAGATGAAGASGAAGAGAAGLGPGRGAPGFAADGAGVPGFAAGLAAAAPDSDLVSAPAADGNDSRRRRATGASTVDDADFTNSPCSLSVASSSLLVTPSSLANSCTRALPATALLTDEVEQEASHRCGSHTTSGYSRWTIIVGASRCAHECLCLFFSRGTAFV